MNDSFEIFSTTKDILSQWHKCSFRDKFDTLYNSTEQYMMAEKALLFEGKNGVYDEIMQSKDMKIIKNLGKKVEGFNQELWDEKKEQIVYDGNYLKFSQNEKFKKYLLSTKNSLIIEANPNDTIWACGLSPNNPNLRDKTQWKGKNLLGFILMRVRENLSDNSYE
ncbi:MAG: NADAR family protein [Campylobacterota bacterium]|nr:NADAR family protein [Campylobacterota bacterium]